MSKRSFTITAIIVAVILLASVVWFFYLKPQTSETPTPQPTQTNQQEQGTQPSQPTTYPVKVYFSKHPESDDDPTKTFAVDRTSPTSGVGKYALEQLIAGPTAKERDAGYFSDVKLLDDSSNCDGADFSLIIKNGVATLEFCRTFDAVGTLSDGRANETIKATFLQFPTVKKVIILGKDGHCQFDLSGEDRCKQ